MAVAAVAVSALALSACASGGSTPAESSSGDAAEGFGTLAVQLSWIKNEEFAGDFFAMENGYYTDAGFDEVTLTPGPSTGAAELISGTADVAFSDAVSIGSVVAAEGAPLKIMISSGGFTSGKAAAETPILLLESGPAGGVLSALNTARNAGIDQIRSEEHTSELQSH